MATQKKTAEVDYSMQEKILALYDLQKIDSQIDSINKVKGELPLEVQDLDDELAGLKARVENINAEIEELNALSKQRKREVDQAKILIGNYKEQQNNVRNNREFDAISKEIEYQELEIELAEKRLKEYSAGVKAKKLQLEEAEAVAEGRAADLAAKKNELEGIEAETAPQVAAYEVQADRAKAKIDERLLSAYGRIRRNVRNGQEQVVAGIHVYPVDYFNPLDSVTGKLTKTENTYSIHWYSMSWLPKRKQIRAKVGRVIRRIRKELRR